MYQSINFYDFERAFKDYNRSNNFSYSGLRALFEYLEGYEGDTGESIELDVIALCCEYNEYENVGDFMSEHDFGIDRIDFETEEEYIEAVKEEIQNVTTLIEIEDSEGFIIQQY